eukprot:11273217-Alexandrium_andersonii.AAC.1
MQSSSCPVRLALICVSLPPVHGGTALTLATADGSPSTSSTVGTTMANAGASSLAHAGRHVE